MDPLSIYIFNPSVYAQYDTVGNRPSFPETPRPAIFNSNLKNNRYINLVVTINSMTETTMTFTTTTNTKTREKTVTLFKPLDITDYPIFTMVDGFYRARATDVA